MKEEQGKKSSLKAAFMGNAHNRVCTIVIDPYEEQFTGEKFKAMLRAAKRSFLVTQILIDDVTSHPDPAKAEIAASWWYALHRSTLKEAGVYFNKIKLWSELQEDEYYGQKVRDINSEYKRTRDVKKLVDNMLIKQYMAEYKQGVTSILALKNEFNKLADRFAGLAFYNATPVISTYELPHDPRIIERAKNMSHCPNSMVFPELLEVRYFKDKPKDEPLLKADLPDEPASADILPFKRPEPSN